MSTPPAPVVLVAPPFRPLVWPALGLSLLKAHLARHGFAAEILYVNLQLADRVGAHVYETAGNWSGLSLGEFLFSCVRFDKGRKEIQRYVEKELLPTPLGKELAVLLPRERLAAALARLVDRASELCDDAARQIVERRPWLVGFSSLHQEHLASLAIARRLKQLDPAIVTIVGGANTEGAMGEELLAQFPEVDLVAQGECEGALVELVREHHGQRPRAPIAGIVRRDLPPAPRAPTAVPREVLEDAPPPEFDDYFAQWRRMRRPRAIAPGLAIEASRGCWWGAKQPCTFCGLANENWAFRAKSAACVLREVEHLVARHGVRHVWTVDLILEPRAFRDLLPALSERTLAQFFWETSGALSKPQVRLLARSHARSIQAGIESLSDHSLRLMRKPTTRLRNLQTLKWCREMGITVAWNFLCGMPGEAAEEVGDIEALVAAIPHFEPPSEAHLVRVQRFSPYFERAAELGFGAIAPAGFYRHLYPVPEASLARLALHFEAEYTGRYVTGPAYPRLAQAMGEWRRRHHRSHLEIVAGRRGDWLVDTRPGKRRRLRRLTAVESAVLAACDAAAARSELEAAVPAGTDPARVSEALAGLMRDQVVLELDGRYLGVALRRETWPAPSWPAAARINRPRPGDALRAIRLLGVAPLDLLHWGLRRTPRVLRSVARRLVAAAWTMLAASARRLLKAPRRGAGPAAAANLASDDAA